MLYSRNTNTSGNLIQHNLRTSMNERTHFFIKIYLSFYSQKGPIVCCWFGRWMERLYTQREDFFPYLLLGARGCQHLHSLASSSETTSNASNRLCVPHSTDSLPLSKSDCVDLIVWSPSGYTPVVPECPDYVVLFTNHNVTACQSTWGH